jgi:hypothetical protein
MSPQRQGTPHGFHQVSEHMASPGDSQLETPAIGNTDQRILGRSIAAEIIASPLICFAV